MNAAVQHFDPNKDYGTPAVQSDVEVTLTIDGRSVTVPEGTSVMRASSLAGIDIPKLCASDNLEGIRLLPSLPGVRRRNAWVARILHHAVREGMVVSTQNKQLEDTRSNVMELYISDHRWTVSPVPAMVTANCRDMAGAVGLRDVRYGFDGENHLQAEKTPPTLTSPSTPVSALSALAVCAPVKKCRAPSH